MAVLTALGGVLQLLTQIPVVHSRLGGREAEFGPLWVPVDRPRRVGDRRVDPAAAGRPAGQTQAAGLAGGRGAVRGGRRRARAEGAASGGHRGLRRACWWPCSGTGACSPRPRDPPSLLRLVRFVPLYLFGVLLFGFVALWVERGRMTPDLTIGGALVTILGGPGRAGRALHLQLAVLRRLLPGGADRAGCRRAGGLRGSCCSGRWWGAGRTPRTTGSTPTGWCGPTAGTPWPTSRCATTRASSSPPTARPCWPTPTSNGYALVAADPIGARESVIAVLDEFLAMCAERAWNPAFLAVREASMPLYASRGFSSFYLGDEAILDCARFSLAGAARKSLRAGGPPGRSELHLLADHGVQRVAAAGRAAQRDQRQVAGQGSRAGLHHVAEPGRHRSRGEPGLPALRRARRGRRARRVPARGAGLRPVLRLHARPDAPRPGRAQRHDRVPASRPPRRPWASAACGGCR